MDEMKKRSALKGDLFAGQLRKGQIDDLGDPLAGNRRQAGVDDLAAPGEIAVLGQLAAHRLEQRVPSLGDGQPLPEGPEGGTVRHPVFHLLAAQVVEASARTISSVGNGERPRRQTGFL